MSIFSTQELNEFQEINILFKSRSQFDSDRAWKALEVLGLEIGAEDVEKILILNGLISTQSEVNSFDKEDAY